MKKKRKIDKINGFWENKKKKGRSSQKRDFVSRCMEKIKRVLIGHRVF